MAYMQDYHMHSDLSHDARSPMPPMAIAASGRGITEIAFTEHLCYDEFSDSWYGHDVDAAYEKLLEARRLAPRGVRLLYAIELGQPQQDPATAAAVLESHPYDFVVGSIHRLRGKADINKEPPSALRELDALMEEYWEQSLTLARMVSFDVMGHIGYPLRYCERIPPAERALASIDRYAPQAEGLLAELAGAGRGIEINTQGLRRGGEMAAGLKILRMFHEAGGEIVTVGSDAHCEEEAGAGIKEAIELARAAGFSRIASYAERKPRMMRI